MMKKNLLTFLLFLFSYPAWCLNDVLKVKLSGGGQSDETIIRFLPTATSGFDYDFDAWKMLSNDPAAISILSKLADNSLMSINALPELTAKTEVALFIQIANAGIYTIQSEELGGFHAMASLVLEDHFTGMTYDFRNGASISLFLNVSNVNDSSRFTVHFSPVTYYTMQNVSCFSFQDGGIGIVKRGNLNWSVVLKNSLGATIHAASNISDSIWFANLPSGNYTAYTSSPFTTDDSNSFYIDQPAPIVSDFSVQTIQPFVSSSIQFMNESQNGQMYLWDFGDGSPFSSDLSPEHTYYNPGTYPVTLHVFNGNCSISFTDSVFISSSPLTNIEIEPSNSDFLITREGDALNIFYNGPSSTQEGILSVYDISGKKIYATSGFTVPLQVKIPLSVSGIYLIVFVNDFTSLHKKISFTN
ncbi:MAG: PKD domain-containing protein [Bacteroidetes bacterium]|nr:PKD domain-containing protein [Bacteroidota bacterium]